MNQPLNNNINDMAARFLDAAQTLRGLRNTTLFHLDKDLIRAVIVTHRDPKMVLGNLAKIAASNPEATFRLFVGAVDLWLKAAEIKPRGTENGDYMGLDNAAIWKAACDVVTDIKADLAEDREDSLARYGVKKSATQPRFTAGRTRIVDEDRMDRIRRQVSEQMASRNKVAPPAWLVHQEPAQAEWPVSRVTKMGFCTDGVGVEPWTYESMSNHIDATIETLTVGTGETLVSVLESLQETLNDYPESEPVGRTYVETAINRMAGAPGISDTKKWAEDTKTKFAIFSS